MSLTIKKKASDQLILDKSCLKRSPTELFLHVSADLHLQNVVVEVVEIDCIAFMRSFNLALGTS